MYDDENEESNIKQQAVKIIEPKKQNSAALSELVITPKIASNNFHKDLTPLDPKVKQNVSTSAANPEVTETKLQKTERSKKAAILIAKISRKLSDKLKRNLLKKWSRLACQATIREESIVRNYKIHRGLQLLESYFKGWLDHTIEI